jgi:hypothetical protein
LGSRRKEAIAAREDGDPSRETEAVIGGKLDLNAISPVADLKVDAPGASVAP